MKLNVAEVTQDATLTLPEGKSAVRKSLRAVLLALPAFVVPLLATNAEAIPSCGACVAPAPPAPHPTVSAGMTCNMCHTVPTPPVVTPPVVTPPVVTPPVVTPPVVTPPVVTPPVVTPPVVTPPVVTPPVVTPPVVTPPVVTPPVVTPPVVTPPVVKPPVVKPPVVKPPVVKPPVVKPPVVKPPVVKPPVVKPGIDREHDGDHEAGRIGSRKDSGFKAVKQTRTRHDD